MSKISKTGEGAGVNSGILAYMHHIEQTAQPEAARRVFELFAQQEAQRMDSASSGAKPAVNMS